MRKKFLSTLMLAVLLGAAALGTSAVSAAGGGEGPEEVRFHFLNVNSLPVGEGIIGSADCIVIEDNGIVTVVDTGREYDISIQKITGYLDTLGVETIDHLFISHPHDDHARGVPALFARYDVKNFYIKPSDWTRVRPVEVTWRTRENYDDAYLAAMRKRNRDGSTVNIVQPDTEGQTVTLNDDSKFEIFCCTDAFENNYYDAEFNDYSMVMKYTYRGVSALLMGDLNRQYEYQLHGKVGECKIFKLAHHGTENSLSSDTLLDEIQAEVAVVTGALSHVGPSVAPTMQRYGIEYKVTHNGDVLVTTDGTGVSLSQKTE